ncbi:saccharopine dehydrogenase NADP-binding domain-containing protein [Candidatus Uhrbacteria bacterium]|nr:saccharopine dehydrogenase NADP-binding domain-containing protein [Candidatus Uhrbacteria bacterium]
METSVPRCLVVGGTGGVGALIAELLLRETNVRVTVAGRSQERVAAMVAQLRAFASDRVAGCVVDLAHDDLDPVLRGYTLVVQVTTATAAIPRLADACIRMGVDYVDCSTQHVLASRAAEVRDAGRCFIVQAGFHPGLPAAFVRAAASSFDRYDAAVVAMAMRARFRTEESAVEIVDMLAAGLPEIFADGHWRASTYRDAHLVDFGAPFGTQRCYPIDMPELRTVPESLGLRKVMTVVGGFGGPTDLLLMALMPIAMIAYRIRPGWGRRTFARWFVRCANRFLRGAPGIVFLVDAEGQVQGRARRLRIRAEHADPFAFTAIPVIACIRQYLAQHQSGLFAMGNFVDPEPLLADMERMGIRIDRTWSDRS